MSLAFDEWNMEQNRTKAGCIMKHIGMIFLIIAMTAEMALAQSVAAVPGKAEANQAPAAPLKITTLADIKTPANIKAGLPINIAIMDFVTGTELMLGGKNTPSVVQTFAKIISAAKNNTCSIPLGATYLGIELQKLNPNLFSVVPGRQGAGFEDLESLQQAVLGNGVTHVILCMLSDIHHKEDANSGNYYGVDVTRTFYSLELNVFVYDLVNKKTVIADTFTAECVENRPFNEKYIDRNMFETLLRKVSVTTARGIVDMAENWDKGNDAASGGK